MTSAASQGEPSGRLTSIEALEGEVGYGIGPKELMAYYRQFKLAAFPTTTPPILNTAVIVVALDRAGELLQLYGLGAARNRKLDGKKRPYVQVRTRIGRDDVWVRIAETWHMPAPIAILLPNHPHTDEPFWWKLETPIEEPPDDLPEMDIPHARQAPPVEQFGPSSERLEMPPQARPAVHPDVVLDDEDDDDDELDGDADPPTAPVTLETLKEEYADFKDFVFDRPDGHKSRLKGAVVLVAERAADQLRATYDGHWKPEEKNGRIEQVVLLKLSGDKVKIRLVANEIMGPYSTRYVVRWEDRVFQWPEHAPQRSGLFSSLKGATGSFKNVSNFLRKNGKVDPPDWSGFMPKFRRGTKTN